MKSHIFLLPLLLSAAVPCHAQAQAPQTPMPGQILVTGTLADEAGKAAVLARLRELYGAERVVDQIAIGNVAVPANWNAYVQKLIAPNLKLISRGQISIAGTLRKEGMTGIDYIRRVATETNAPLVCLVPSA